MEQLTPLLIGIISLALGSILGYFTRQSVAKRQIGTLEAKIQKKVDKAQKDAEELFSKAKEKSQSIIAGAEKSINQRREELLKIQNLVLKKENVLENKLSDFENKRKEFSQNIEQLKKIKQKLEDDKKEIIKKLEKVSEMSKKEAKQVLLSSVEKECELDILEKMRKLEKEGEEKFEKRAKEILSFAIQKYALSQAQEITTTTVSLPSDEIKGRIIGKEGRNIKALEKMTGVEIVVDETPEAVMISGFDPIRRQIAKVALEKLMKDGRIQPARIEEVVESTKKEITRQLKEAGEQAVFDTGIIDLDPKLVQLLGRLKFRTSYGQNVLLHSIEVSHLAAALASEIGANVQVCQKAGLLHDIGKAVDHQVQGSHVDIGIKILSKFKIEEEVIDAMKAHHEEYPYSTLESVLVQVADQISGARPGARKDTVENYLKRLEELESIANSFQGVEKSWALQAGREIRVFVKPEEVDDVMAHKLAKEIAKRIHEELKYPGEIKVNVIRETRVLEYAK